MRRLRPLALSLVLAACAHGSKTAALRYKVQRAVPYAGGLKADLYVPEGTGPFPAVVVIHGGGWYKGKRQDMAYVAGRLARRGYVAATVDYRLAPAFRFPAQVHDCKKAVRWLRAHASEHKADPARIGAFGYSAGGHLAAMLGTTGPGDGLEPEGEGDSRVQAVVAGGAPTDLRKFPEGRMVIGFLGVPMAQDAELFKKASPVAYVNSGDAPTFFYHGAKDTLVPPDHMTDMFKALEEAGVDTQAYLVQGLGHVRVYLFSRASVDEAIGFLDQKLKG